MAVFLHWFTNFLMTVSSIGLNMVHIQRGEGVQYPPNLKKISPKSNFCRHPTIWQIWFCFSKLEKQVFLPSAASLVFPHYFVCKHVQAILNSSLRYGYSAKFARCKVALEFTRNVPVCCYYLCVQRSAGIHQHGVQRRCCLRLTLRFSQREIWWRYHQCYHCTKQEWLQNKGKESRNQGNKESRNRRIKESKNKK